MEFLVLFLLIAMVAHAVNAALLVYTDACEEHVTRRIQRFEYTGDVPLRFRQGASPRTAEFNVEVRRCDNCGSTIFRCTVRHTWAKHFTECGTDLALSSAPENVRTEILELSTLDQADGA